MAESAKNVNAASTSSGTRSVWDECKPKSIDRVNVMSHDRVEQLWERMYAEAGLRNPTEQERRMFRMALYVYCWYNGTSRVGEYSGYCTMTNGKKFPAAVLPRVVGKMDVRRFMRGNMQESYEALKSGVIEEDTQAVALATAYGVRGSDAFALADWLTGCPLFTPEEGAAHNRVFNHRVTRANLARGGKSLDQVEDLQRDDGLSAQAPVLERGASHMHSDF